MAWGWVCNAGGISKNGGLPNYAVVLDSTNYRVGIGGSSNALNPVNTLEVLGGQRIKNPAGADELVLDANTIGLIAGTNTLKLYSHNNNSDIANTQVDGGNNMLWVGGTVRPRDPVAFDLPNSSNNEGLFKLKLEQGYNLDNPPNPPFDVQEPLSNLNGNFPIGNIVDWCSTQPLRMPKIIGRIAWQERKFGIRRVRRLGLLPAVQEEEGEGSGACKAKPKLGDFDTASIIAWCTSLRRR